MTEIKDIKLIRDMLGSPIPQYLNEDLEDYVVKTVDGSTVTRGDIDFSKTKLLRDKLGSPIPQLWDNIINKWVVDTRQGVSSGGGETGPFTWDSITDKPTDFKPGTHTHRISEISGLQEKLEELWAAIGVVPEEPESEEPYAPPTLAGYDYPELIGKKWMESNGFIMVLDDLFSDFYSDGTYIVGNGSVTRYQKYSTYLSAPTSFPSNTQFATIEQINLSNTNIYSNSNLTTIARNADNGKPVELVKTYGFTSYKQTGFNDSLASYGGSYKVLNEVSLVGAKIQLSKTVSDATVELYNSSDVLVSSKKFSSESGFIEVIFDKATLLSGNSTFTLVYRGSSIVEVGSIVYEENLSFNNRLFTFSMTEMPTITNNNYIYYIEPIYAVA